MKKKSKKNKFGRYLIELVIVILGVSVAFWINTISEKNKEAELRKSYYSELIADINDDIRALEFTLNENKLKQDKLNEGIALYDSAEENAEKIIQISFLVGNYIFFEADDLTYKSIIASGDLKLFNNRKIKKGLVSLYSQYEQIEGLQEGFLEALDQNYFPYLVKSIDYSTGASVDKNYHKSIEVKNYIIYTVNEVEIHINRYERALTQAKNIKEILTQELEL